MFTGIVEELGTVRAITPGADHADHAVLTVEGPLVVSDASHGASIAVNGVCLTVVEHDDRTFTADVMAETLRRSSLGALQPGARVNLERPVRVDGRLGGHVVQGHVDGAAPIVARTPGQRWEVVRLRLPDGLARYVVEKGSITLDGVSLTVSSIDGEHVEVSLVPTTLALTTLGHKGVGEVVNVEVDILAKHVERLMAR